jgi:hypothetical protein
MFEKALPWLDRLLSRCRRKPTASGYTVAPLTRFDMMVMPSMREAAIWHP